jgi:hypothetical protein
VDGDLPSPTVSAQRVPPIGWVVALVGPVAVSLALVPVRGEIRTSNVSLVLVIAVLVAAIVGGRIGGAVAALVSMASFDFFFTRPYYSFTIKSREDVETAVLLLVVGGVVGEIVVRARRSRQVAVESRREVGRMRGLAELAAGGEPVGRLVHTVQNELMTLLELGSCRFERPPFASTLPRLQHGSVRVPPVEASPTGKAGRVELPVWGEGRELGRFVLELTAGTTGITLPVEARRTAMALADQLGAILAVASESS